MQECYGSSFGIQQDIPIGCASVGFDAGAHDLFCGVFLIEAQCLHRSPDCRIEGASALFGHSHGKLDGFKKHLADGHGRFPTPAQLKEFTLRIEPRTAPFNTAKPLECAIDRGCSAFSGRNLDGNDGSH